jgi:hypothetical protein
MNFKNGEAVKTAKIKNEFEYRAQELMNIFAQVLPDEFGSVEQKENKGIVSSSLNPPKKRKTKKRKRRTSKKDCKGYMYKPSTPYEANILHHMEEVFDVCNVHFFEGKLKKPRFTLCSKKSYNGQFVYSNSKMVVRNGKWYYIRKNQPTIVFNKDKFDEGENFFWSVMLHEMVHQWVFMTHDYNPKLSHGVEFKACCARLKEKYGVIVTTYHNNEAIPNLEEMVNKIKEKKYE